MDKWNENHLNCPDLVLKNPPLIIFVLLSAGKLTFRLGIPLPHCFVCQFSSEESKCLQEKLYLNWLIHIGSSSLKGEQQLQFLAKLSVLSDSQGACELLSWRFWDTQLLKPLIRAELYIKFSKVSSLWHPHFVKEQHLRPLVFTVLSRLLMKCPGVFSDQSCR